MLRSFEQYWPFSIPTITYKIQITSTVIMMRMAREIKAANQALIGFFLFVLMA